VSAFTHRAICRRSLPWESKTSSCLTTGGLSFLFMTVTVIVVPFTAAGAGPDFAQADAPTTQRAAIVNTTRSNLVDMATLQASRTSLISLDAARTKMRYYLWAGHRPTLAAEDLGNDFSLEDDSRD